MKRFKGLSRTQFMVTACNVSSQAGKFEQKLR